MGDDRICPSLLNDLEDSCAKLTFEAAMRLMGNPLSGPTLDGSARDLWSQYLMSLYEDLSDFNPGAHAGLVEARCFALQELDATYGRRVRVTDLTAQLERVGFNLDNEEWLRLLAGDLYTVRSGMKPDDDWGIGARLSSDPFGPFPPKTECNRAPLPSLCAHG